jgi:hypothetical protein
MSNTHQGALLKQLIEEVKQQLPETNERQLALIKLVDEILRSRRICRPPKGQPLTGVFQEIYQEVHKQLIQMIDKDVDNYKPPSQSVREWLNEKLYCVFKQELTDERLKRIALEAQQHFLGTQKRQYILTELINAIKLSGKLIRPPQGDLRRDFYELIYDDAVNRTLIYVFQKLDNYDQNRGEKKKFMNWVNFRLERIFQEIKFGYQFPNTTLLSNLPPSKLPPTLFEILTEFIESDPEGIFRNEYTKNNPNASFQKIFIAKRVDGKSWQEISEDLGISGTTLSSFYWRCIKKFSPIIKKYVQEFTD